MLLEGSRAFVAGGAHRVGRAITLGLAARGARVAFSYHASGDAAQATLAELRAGGEGYALQADMTRPAGAHAAVQEAARALGGLDVLVYCVSGGFRGVRPDDVDEALFDAAVDSTLKGGFFCAQAARAAMGDGGGTMVLMGDVAAFEPWPLFAPHGAAKAGLAYLVTALAKAWAPAVRVNGVAPGPVLMPDWTDHVSARRSAEETALRRLGTPEDVVRAVTYLIEADYVTGTHLVTDGGKLLQ